MSRVFFVHPVRQDINDISGALGYGDSATFINDGYVYPEGIENQEMPEEHARRIMEAAKQFDPAQDWLAIVGDHLQLVLFAGLLMQVHGHFRVLRWDRVAKGYLPVLMQGFSEEVVAGAVLLFPP